MSNFQAMWIRKIWISSIFWHLRSLGQQLFSQIMTNCWKNFDCTTVHFFARERLNYRFNLKIGRTIEAKFLGNEKNLPGSINVLKP